MSTSSLNTREARLNPEFATLYPTLTAGQWMSAALMTQRVTSWRASVMPDQLTFDRALTTKHFEFRGNPLRVEGATRERQHDTWVFRLVQSMTR